MHWVIAAGSVIGAVAGWRFVIKPLRRAYGEVVLLLQQIRAASGGVQKLALEVHGLAGAVVQFVTRNDQRITALELQTQTFQAGITEKVDDLKMLFIDVAADVARITRDDKPKD